MDILLGLLLVLAGIGLVVSGLRVFFFMLPIAGFIAGFFTGSMLIASWLGDGFLSTVAGWIVGLILGALFAWVSYLYWYIGAIMAAGASGALLLSGLAAAFGVDSGWGLFIAGALGAAIFVFAAVMLNLPVWMVLIDTAIMGGYTVIAGILLLIDRADTADFAYGAAHAAVRDHWLWWLALVAMVAFGIFNQLAVAAAPRLPQNRWSRAAAVANDAKQR